MTPWLKRTHGFLVFIGGIIFIISWEPAQFRLRHRAHAAPPFGWKAPAAAGGASRAGPRAAGHAELPGACGRNSGRPGEVLSALVGDVPMVVKTAVSAVCFFGGSPLFGGLKEAKRRRTSFFWGRPPKDTPIFLFGVDLSSLNIFFLLVG